MTVFYSVAYLTLKHKRYLRKNTMVYAKLVNQVWGSRIDCTNSIINSQPWYPMQLNMHKIVKPVKSRRFYTSTSRATSPDYCFMAIWGMGNRYCRTYLPLINERLSVHPSNNWLFLEVGWNYILIEVKTSNVVNFIKHHVIHRFGVPQADYSW